MLKVKVWMRYEINEEWMRGMNMDWVWMNWKVGQVDIKGLS